MINSNDLSAVEDIIKKLRNGDIKNITPFLPMFFSLKGQPYTLKRHFPFEELFSTQMATSCVFKTARQVAKTTTAAASSIMIATTIPNFTILYIAPLAEQTFRFSTMFVAPFIQQSPTRNLWIDASCRNRVLHRTFKNGSQMIFSFAYLDSVRVRGIFADMLLIDEVQDLNPEHLPVIREVLSASKWGIRRFFGTPKTPDNLLESLYNESSAAEWFIPCYRCTTFGKPTWNIPCREFHILKMIGPLRTDISESNPAVICHKCGKPINPMHGRWVHRKPALVGINNGYHIPQIIMPMHYADPLKWAELLQKQQGAGGTTANKFWNEVLGESDESAVRLVTLDELNAVSNLGPNTIEHAIELCNKNRYITTALAIDWGGGGQEQVSFTVVSLLGLHPNGNIDVLWGRKLLRASDHLEEAAEIKYFWTKFRPTLLAHDFTGAGALRETFLIQSGIPIHRIFPVQYIGPSRGGICTHIPADDSFPRAHYRVDRSRAILTVCAMIKTKGLRFFDSDYYGRSNPGLIRDFLAIYEEKLEHTISGERYRIGRTEGLSDDFVHSVTIGCIALWHSTNTWPNIAKRVRLKITEAETTDPAIILPDNPINSTQQE